jgi:hypothetical protein
MADVTIKLTGSQYRTLVRELEYHQHNIEETWKGHPASKEKHAASKVVAELKLLRGVIAS